MMPLLIILRFFTSIFSWVILGVTIYLLWNWYRGDAVIASDGLVYFVRHDWMLWTGFALLAWSFLGKFLIPLLLARPDTDPSLPLRSNQTKIAGPHGDISVEIHGDDQAPTIILTHGWSLDSTIWYYAKRALAKSFRVVTWDLPGLGRTQLKNRDRIDLANFAQELEAVIAGTSAGRRVTLVGHSIGGMTIQTLARDKPGLFGPVVSGVVLLNTTYTNPLKTMILPRFMQAIRAPILQPVMYLMMALQPLVWLSAWQSYLSGSAHIANRFGFGRFVTRSQLEHVTLLSTRNPPGNIARGNLAMFEWDATGALAGVPVPVLVIGGELDIVTKPSASRSIGASTTGAMVEIVDGVNHMGFLERPALYNGLIANFADRVSA